jgi:hypothetical protein
MIKKLTLTLSLSGALWVTQAFSHNIINNINIDKMAAQADAVFQGTVIDIDYRYSDPVENQPALPHTFVTFAVAEVLHGNVPDNTLTLRFLGGPLKDGGAMMSNQTPKFDIGDEDLLFVRDNGVAECPLVECANGRFRIINNTMYNEYGQQIVLDDNKKMLLGDRVKLEEVDTYIIGDQLIRRKSFDDLSEDDDVSSMGTLSEPVLGKKLEIGTLLENIRRTLHAEKTAGRLVKEGIAKNMDITQPFSIPPAKHVALPEPVLETNQPTFRINKLELPNDEEDLEIEEMRRNGGNHILD